jgi:tetratricopeptide (TPR) repeat protein
MKFTLSLLCFSLTFLLFAQDKDELKQEQLSLKKANGFVYHANELVDADNYVSAEKEYRKAISEQPTNVTGTYNLGNSYYEKGNYDEALFRLAQAAKNGKTKTEKHKAFHNIGNILMKNKKCKEAVEAYKDALRNDPSDDETRYNYALAKVCADKQEDQKKDKDDDKKDESKDDKKDKEDKKDDKGDDQKEDQKEGDDKKEENGKPKDDKKDEGKNDKKDEKENQGQPKQQPGQLSPQQIKNILEAMNNQEQKVQEKMNAEKQKGTPVKSEKDW